MGFAELEGLSQRTGSRLPPRPSSRLPRPHLQLLGAVAQQHKLWVGPWEVFHYQVVAEDGVKVSSGGQRQVGAPGDLLMLNSTALFTEVGQVSPFTREEVRIQRSKGTSSIPLSGSPH